jgi:hypothetical protein
MPHLLIHLIKLLVWASEHMPDDPCVGWKCIGSGSVLAAVAILPQRFTEEQLGLFPMRRRGGTSSVRIICVFSKGRVEAARQTGKADNFAFRQIPFSQ